MTIAAAYLESVQLAESQGPDAAPDPWEEIQPALQPFVAVYDLTQEAVAVTAAGFWVRRTIDGSREEFRIGLEKLLRTFDSGVLQN